MTTKPLPPIIQTIAEKSSNLFTLSKLYFNGSFICYVLEDPIRTHKIMHITAIPSGVYFLKLITWGRHHDSYKKRFHTQHHGIFQLQNVPNFTGINIHIGNNTADSSGCLLTGVSYSMLSNGDCVLNKSTEAYLKLYSLFVEAYHVHKSLKLFHRCSLEPFS